MPELPEILTIKKDLRKEIRGKRIVSVLTTDGYELKPSESDFKKYAEGSAITEIDNVAKLLTVKLSSGAYIAVHLNMSGLLLYNTTDPYVKVTLIFDGGGKLHYSDTRLFGFFELWTVEKLAQYKNSHGMEALDSNLTADLFSKILKSKNTNIKNALMDQKLIGGVGNIYANEALFLSRINPKSSTRFIADSHYGKLLKNVKVVLNEGIKNRGSSIDRYRDIYNVPGRQQNYFRIYGKSGGSCIDCKNKIVFEKLNGRGTYYCPFCQPSTV